MNTRDPRLGLENGQYIKVSPITLSQLGSTRTTFTMNENGGAMTTMHAMPEKYPATIDVRGRKFKTMPAQGKIPEYLWMRVSNVNLNLRDGVKPDQNGKITGLFEIKTKKRTETGKGEKTLYFLYINVFPLPQETKPEYNAVVDEKPVNPISGSYHFGPTVGTNREAWIHLYPMLQ